MFTSIGSRSSSFTSASTASWDIGPSSRTARGDTVPPMAGPSFPEGFRWGTATAAHQIEGGNVNNDWWRWEHNPDSGCKESSGDCCDSWHRWPEDVALLQELGFTDYRFSLEWSRIEPAEGEFSTVALDHYARRVRGRSGRRASRRSSRSTTSRPRSGSPTWAAGSATTCPSASPPTARRRPPASTA